MIEAMLLALSYLLAIQATLDNVAWVTGGLFLFLLMLVGTAEICCRLGTARSRITLGLHWLCALGIAYWLPVFEPLRASLLDFCFVLSALGFSGITFVATWIPSVFMAPPTFSLRHP